MSPKAGQTAGPNGLKFFEPNMNSQLLALYLAIFRR